MIFFSVREKYRISKHSVTTYHSVTIVEYHLHKIESHTKRKNQIV